MHTHSLADYMRHIEVGRWEAAGRLLLSSARWVGPTSRPAAGPSFVLRFLERLGALASLGDGHVTRPLTPRPAAAQESTEQSAVVAVADAALAAITRGDMTAFTDLMLPEAVMFSTSTRDGASRYRLRTRAEQRAAAPKATVTERGFRPEVRVNGPVAIVWYPYDLYLDGKCRTAG